MKKTFYIFICVVWALVSQAQCIYNDGACIKGQDGVCWVVSNGNFTLTSENAANPATMGNLKIESGASLTIGSSSYLTVTGTLTNSAGNSGLVMNSGSSLIEGTTGVPATVKRNIPADEWHLIAAPVTDATANMFLGYYLQKHTESTNLYTDIIDPATPLTPMKGFALWGEAVLPTANYSGTLNAGSKSLTTTKAGSGWNLVGNPYPSSIDWDAVSGWTKTNVDNATYIHKDNATWASYVGGVGANGGSRYIAPGQGFFVKATASGLLGVTDEVRVHREVQFFKSSDQLVNNLVRLQVSGNNYQDEAVVRFLPEATLAFDGNYDAHKLFGDVAAAAQIYTMGTEQLAINSLPETNTVPLGIHAGANGSYTIAATEINDINTVTLEDTKTGVFTNLLNDSYTFDFTTGENEVRFILHFGPLSVKEAGGSRVNIFSYEKKVTVDLKELLKADIFIYSMNGQLVASESATGAITRIDLSVPGIYIVKVVSEKDTFVKKVKIQ